MADPTLAIAERQLDMLGELAEISMCVCRAEGSAAVAASAAAKAAVMETAWQCERDRALALGGAKAAADAFQKVSRSLRLTLRLEMTVAEWLRDVRAGVSRPFAASRSGRAGVLRDHPAESVDRETEAQDTSESERECLDEYEHQDRFLNPPPLAEEGDSLRTLPRQPSVSSASHDIDLDEKFVVIPDEAQSAKIGDAEVLPLTSGRREAPSRREAAAARWPP